MHSSANAEWKERFTFTWNVLYSDDLFLVLFKWLGMSSSPQEVWESRSDIVLGVWIIVQVPIRAPLYRLNPPTIPNSKTCCFHLCKGLNGNLSRLIRVIWGPQLLSGSTNSIFPALASEWRINQLKCVICLFIKLVYLLPSKF